MAILEAHLGLLVLNVYTCIMSYGSCIARASSQNINGPQRVRIKYIPFEIYKAFPTYRCEWHRVSTTAETEFLLKTRLHNHNHSIDRYDNFVLEVRKSRNDVTLSSGCANSMATI